MLVIEHDMPLIMSISDRVYCLEIGRVIAEGDPGDRPQRPEVIASYLGVDERAIQRSGTATTATAAGGGQPRREDETMTTIDWRTRFAGLPSARDAQQLFAELTDRSSTPARWPRAAWPTRLDPLGVRHRRRRALTSRSRQRPSSSAKVGRRRRSSPSSTRRRARELCRTWCRRSGSSWPGRVRSRSGSGRPVRRLGAGAARGCSTAGPCTSRARSTFRDRDGGALDLSRGVRLDDEPEEIGHFLAEAGFLHLEGVFTEDEMAAVSAELDAAVAAAERDDGASWWARTDGGGWYPSRILGFNQKSPTLQRAARERPLPTIGTFTDDRDGATRSRREGDSAEGLLKKIGVRRGHLRREWHKDCTMGGHSRGCCGLTVGISVTGADGESGELGVVAGSHRANVQAVGVRPASICRASRSRRDRRRDRALPCTLHMSRPPVDRERRVVYTGFSLAPRPGDVHEELTRRRSGADVRR